MARNGKGTPPHYGVYTRLRPSRRGGVGVFAVRAIRKGTPVFYKDEDEIVWVEKGQLQRLPGPIRRLYDDFCIIKDGGRLYGCPANFNRLTVSWYLNFSSKPNVACDREFRFWAARDINAGEELTVDYLTYSELPASAHKRAAMPKRNASR
jgi:SET domain-containing protein